MGTKSDQMTGTGHIHSITSQHRHHPLTGNVLWLAGCLSGRPHTILCSLSVPASLSVSISITDARDYALAGWLTLWWLVAGDDWMACLLPACLPWFSCNQSNNSQTYIKWHYIILLAAWLQSGWAERINRDWNAHQPSLHTAISRRWLFAGIVIKPQRPAEITIYTHIGCCGGWWWWWNAVLG